MARSWPTMDSEAISYHMGHQGTNKPFLLADTMRNLPAKDVLMPVHNCLGYKRSCERQQLSGGHAG